MKPLPFFALLLPLMLPCVQAAPAPASGPELEVGAVKFNSLRAGTGNWLEADVVLNVRPPAGTPGQMLSRVRVALLLGFELPAAPGGERKLEHYRAEAECVALENGRADVRFYLPPTSCTAIQNIGAWRWRWAAGRFRRAARPIP